MKKLLLLIMLILTVGFSSVTSANKDAGYDCSDWAVDSVSMAYAIGLVDEAYVFTEEICREDFCELIYNLILQTDYFEKWHDEQTKDGTLPIPPYTKRPFDDTESIAVNTLHNHNIVYGKTDSEFAPDDGLTREEAATIIVRMLNIVHPMVAQEVRSVYVDVADMSDWAEESICKISALGFMRGVGDNRFAPKETYTAEQAVVTCLRVYNAIKDNSVLKFVDKDDNIILTENDVSSCEAVFGELVRDVGKEWYLDIALTNDGREKFRKATKIIKNYYENYIAVIFGDSVISKPTVIDEIDSESVILTGAFTEESVKALENIFNFSK